MNLSAVAALPHRPIAAVWYRAIKPRYFPNALSYKHTRLYASRYYEGATAAALFDTFYLAETPLAAQFEVEALFGSPFAPHGLVPNPAGSWLILNAEVQLTKVADLTCVSGSHVPLSSTTQELTGDWQEHRRRSGSCAPTQELGAALYASGLFEGFVAISAKLPGQTVLGVFPDRIKNGNFVRFSYENSAGQEQRLQIPSTTL